MKVTLKRADVYARAALKAATEVKYEAILRLSIYSPALNPSMSTFTSPITDEFTKARTKLLNQHGLAIELIRARKAIRLQLAHANTVHGISELLTEKSRLELEESRMVALLKAMENDTHVEKSADAMLAKATAIRNQATERYMGREDTVSMAAFTDEDVANVRKQIKRIVDERGSINDTLTALNVSNSITLDSSTVATLRKADILTAE
jgi:hypothetical protein